MTVAMAVTVAGTSMQRGVRQGHSSSSGRVEGVVRSRCKSPCTWTCARGRCMCPFQQNVNGEGYHPQPGGFFDLQPVSFSNELIFSNRFSWVKTPERDSKCALHWKVIRLALDVQGHCCSRQSSQSLLHNGNCPPKPPIGAQGYVNRVLGVDIDANCRGSSAVENWLRNKNESN